MLTQGAVAWRRVPQAELGQHQREAKQERGQESERYGIIEQGGL